MLRLMPKDHLTLIDDFTKILDECPAAVDNNALETSSIKKEITNDGTVKEEDADFGGKILSYMIDKNKFLELKSKLNNNNVDADDDRDSLTESVPDEDREDPNDPEWCSPTLGGSGSSRLI